MKEKLLKLRNEFNSIANEFEQELREKHNAEMHQAERRGRHDGLENHPRSESTKRNSVEREIFYSYNVFLHEFRFDVEGFLTRIKTDYVAILDAKSRLKAEKVTTELKELEGKTYRELQRLEDEYHEKIALLNEDGVLLNLREKFLEADDLYDELCKQNGRKSSDIIWDIPNGLYAFILLSLGLAEVVAMYNAFLGFEEPPVTTWVWAIMFGLGMAIFSHFNGIVFARSRANKWRILKGVFVAALAFVTIYTVSKVRMEAMDEDVPVKHISLEAFFAISYILYLGGVFLSYLTHDSDNRFYRALKAREKLQEEIHKRKSTLYDKKMILQHELQNKEKFLNDSFEQERGRIMNQPGESANLLRDAIALHDEILQGALNFEKFIVQLYKECIEVYRRNNSETRTEPEPIYWAELIPDLETVFDKIEKLDTNNKNPGLWHYN